MNNKVHFIGVGGIGMSALARYFLSEGWRVSGSDLSPSDITKDLKKDGARISVGHSAKNISRDLTKVIYNQAIPKSNQELQAAKQFGISISSYPEEIGKLVKKYKTIAVAGSHGKSTTTAMTTLVLMEAGLDPTVIIGTKLKEFGNKNFRKGNSRWLVLEADEFGGAFWHYSPAVSVITNVDKEHLDFYKNFANVKKSFARFKKQSVAVVSAVKEKKILAEIKKVLKVPGQHNVYNASCAYSVAKYLKIPHATILRGLGKYLGVWRRMEFKGKFGNAMVFDDYAHHPSEIKATLSAFKEKWPQNPLICVFQAHQAHRLKALFPEFKTAFRVADKVILLPTYIVAGREKKLDKTKNSKVLAKLINAEYVEDSKNLRNIVFNVTENLKKPAIVVMMGAGNIVDLTLSLIKNRPH